MTPGDVSEATKAVQIFTLLAYLVLTFFSISWFVYAFKRRARHGMSYFLSVPFILIGLHGLIFYTCLILSWYGIIPERAFLYELFEVQGESASDQLLFTQWSAIMRAQATVLDIVFVGTYLALLRLDKKKAKHENPESQDYGC